MFMTWAEFAVGLGLLLIAGRLVTKKHYGLAVVVFGLFLIVINY